jgi:hypothetical protein
MAQRWARLTLRQILEAHKDGICVRHIVITDGASTSGSLTGLDDFQGRFNRLTRDIKRTGFSWQYISVLGVNEDTGRLHRHLVALGGPSAEVLRERATRAGLGYVAVKRIRPTKADSIRRTNYIAVNGLHAAQVLGRRTFSRSRRPS